MTRTLLAATATALVLSAAAAQAAEPLKIGVTATLEGTYTVLGEDGMRGFEVALREWNKTVAGRPLEIIVASTDASPDSAVRAVRKLVEQDQVEVVISPLSGSEGIAIRDYAKTQPEMTFINAASGAQETTFVTPAENFFRFNMDGAQWQAGLGDYIYNDKGYRTIATVGEDYSFVYTQVFGLALEFCAAGGEITERFWVPLGTKDFASIIAALPDDVDAIYLGLGGGDAVNFLNQYVQAGGSAKLIGGSIMVDQTVLSSKGQAKEALIGAVAASGQADTWDDPQLAEVRRGLRGSPPGQACPRCSRPTTTIRRPRCSRRSRRSAATSARATTRSARRCATWCSMRPTARSSSTTTGRRSAPTSSPRCPRTPTAISSATSSRSSRTSTRRSATTRRSSARSACPAARCPSARPSTELLTSDRAAPCRPVALAAGSRGARADRPSVMSLISYLTRIHFADGVVEEALAAELDDLGIRRPLIVADRKVAAAGLLERVEDALPAAHDAGRLRGRPRPGRREAAAVDLAGLYRAVRLRRPRRARRRHHHRARQGRSAAGQPRAARSAASPCGGGRLGLIRDVLPPIIAIPTTAGSGAEVVRGAGVALADGQTLRLCSAYLIPKVAICDPTLTLGLPPASHRRHRHGRAQPLHRDLRRDRLQPAGRRHRARRHRARRARTSSARSRTAATSPRAAR